MTFKIEYTNVGVYKYASKYHVTSARAGCAPCDLYVS